MLKRNAKAVSSKGHSSSTDCCRDCIPAVFQREKGARVSQKELGLFFLNSFDFKKTFTRFQLKKQKSIGMSQDIGLKKPKTTTKKFLLGRVEVKPVPFLLALVGI